MVWHYSIYGLNLEVNHPVPGLTPHAVASSADVEVKLQSIPASVKEALMRERKVWHTSLHRDGKNRPALQIWTTADDKFFLFRYSDGTRFIIDRDGTRIWADWPDELCVENTAIYLLGPVLGFVLRLRGKVCLHASAVVVENRAIVFAGPPGAGKSTTAAALAEAGCSILSDDVVVLGEQRECFFVEPGYSHLRLWPDSATSLYGPHKNLPRLTPGWEKLYLSLAQEENRFEHQPRRLAAIYILSGRSDSSEAPFITPLYGCDAFIEMVANAHANQLLDQQMRAREFALLTRLAANLPVRKITPRDDAKLLPELCRRILDDYAAISGAGLVRQASIFRMKN